MSKLQDKVQTLIDKTNYTHRAAKAISIQLDNMQYPDLKSAITDWFERGVELNVGNSPYDTASLMRNHKMNYPSAVLFVNLYRTMPGCAKQKLAYWDGIVK